MITEQLQLFEQAFAKLMMQFRGEDQTELRKLLANLVAPVQEAASVAYDIYRSDDLDTAADAQLDTLGAIVGEKREGRTDAAYRVAIRARIAINLATGTPNEVLDIMRAVVGEPGELFENDTAAFLYRVVATMPDTATAELYAAVLRSISPAGVRSIFQYGIEEISFQFDGPDGTGFDQDGGFEDVI